MEKSEIKNKRAKIEDIALRKAPFVIYLDPCGMCNFKCNFCPTNNSNYMAAERHKVMDWELFKKIVNDIKALEDDVKVINLYAYGEPLLHPRIADMVRELKDGCCREVRITTNASLLTGEMSRALIDAGLDLLRVSVEALSDEGYKEVTGVDVKFKDIVGNVEKFYELSRGTNSKISAKIVSATFKSEDDKQLFYNMFAPIADYRFIMEVEDYWVDYKVPDYPKDINNPHNYCYAPGEQKRICAEPFTTMCIYSNGYVGACSEDWKFGTNYGDVNKQSIKDIWHSERRRCLITSLLNKDLTNWPYCDKCEFKGKEAVDNPQLILEKLNNYGAS